jgi:hypothetical protein
MALSLLSISLSQARNYSCISIAKADVATTSEGEEALHQSSTRDQRHENKQAQVITDVD